MVRALFVWWIAIATVIAIFAWLGKLQLVSSTSPLPSVDTQNTRKEVFMWKLATAWPRDFPILHQSMEKLSKDIEIMSGGRLKIQIYAGGEIVAPFEIFNAVSQGTIQMGHTMSFYAADKIPAAQFISAVPFGMNTSGMEAWLYKGGGLELWRELYAPFNLIPFPAGSTSMQMGGWFKKRIESIKDFKGLRIRLPGLGGAVLAKAGAKIVSLPASELYQALEKDVIDAAEWVGPYHDESLKLYHFAKYYYYPGWHEPGPILELIVNKSAWEQLPPDLQTMITIETRAIHVWIHSQFGILNIRTLHELQKRYKVEVVAFPKPVLNKLKELTKEVLDEKAKYDPLFRRIYDAYSAFQADNHEWHVISDEAYIKALKE